MSILDELSSQSGDRSEASNRKAVLRVLNDPGLLDEVAAGLASPNALLAGDCAEVLTQTAADHPGWVAPYASALAAQLGHRNTRVRWEVTHALAEVAGLAPQVVAPLLPALAHTLRSDASIIVRDYTTDVLAGYAASGPQAAQAAFPLLKEALQLWDGRHAGHALRGLAAVARHCPEYADELRLIAAQGAQAGRAVVRKAAKELQKALGI